MKRFTILAALMVAAVLIFQSAYPSVTVRYRLTLDADVGGKPATGSGVIEVTYRKNPRLLGASADITTEVSGEAVSIAIGPGVVLALLAPGSHVRSSPEDIVPVLFGITSGGIGPQDFSSIRALSGRRNLPFEFLPALIRFDDPRDPGTAKLSSSLDAKLRSASIEIVDAGFTGVPVTREIGQKLPWVSDEPSMAKFWRALYASGYRPNGSVEPRMLLTRP